MYTIPKPPKVKLKPAPPDQRKFCVLPIGVIKDKRFPSQTIRVLALLCSFCNRAGVTWVSKQRLADELQVSQPAISKHIGLLKRYGYIETLVKHHSGARTATLRVIYDKDILAQDAISRGNDFEDCRPPDQITKELNEMNQPKQAVKVLINKKEKKGSQSVVDSGKKPVIKRPKVSEVVMSNTQTTLRDELVKRAVLKESSISEKDIEAIELVANQADVSPEAYLQEISELYRMISSEGLSKPSDILAVTQQILTGKGL